MQEKERDETAMRDGQVEHGRVWFCFDAQELDWLYALIPEGDEFRKTVAVKIRELEESERQRINGNN